MDWKHRWVEHIGDPISQYDAWEAHWLVLHPEDTPPSEIDDEDAAFDIFFHNSDKYHADPEVQELFRMYGNVRNLDDARRAREAHTQSAKLREDLGYVGICAECESAVYRTLNQTIEGTLYDWRCDSLNCNNRTTTSTASARPSWVQPTYDSIQ